MRIGLAQINTTVGDCSGNVERVARSLEAAASRQVDVVLFPEQTIPGYPAEDLLERRDFVERVEASFEAVRPLCRDVAAVLGTVVRARGNGGNAIHNSAALIEAGQLRLVQHKTLLPTYDVFDEGRYFRPATDHVVGDFRGTRVGLAICEDLWNDPEFWPERRYAVDPVANLVDLGAELIFAISASPFSVGRAAFRHRMLCATARRFGVPIAYVNLVGGNTSLVFDGNSFVVDGRGRLLAHAASFEEELLVCDLDRRESIAVPRRVTEGGDASDVLDSASALSEVEVDEAYRALVLGTRDYLAKSGFQRAVIGLSGGIDSALTAAIACEAIGRDAVTGIAMPSRYSSEGSVTDARDLAKALGIELHELPIEPLFAAALETLEPVFRGTAPDVAEENIQARIRGLLLMAYSNKHGAILLTTGNKSELAVGYCTLYGDMSGGLAVISDVPKMLVYRMARRVNRDREIIPLSTIEKPPSAELRPDQTDQDSLPPYAVLDAVLEGYVEHGLGVEELVVAGYERSVVRRILDLVDRNEYKRKQAAPGLRVTSKAFGPGRRFPIVKRVSRD